MKIIFMLLGGLLCIACQLHAQATTQSADDPALAHTADLVRQSRLRGKDGIAAKRELARGFAAHDPSVFELMSSADPELRTDAVMAAAARRVELFPPAAKASLARAMPYLIDMCESSKDNQELRRFAWLRLSELMPQTAITMTRFILSDDPGLQQMAMRFINDLPADQLTAEQTAILKNATPMIIKLSTDDDMQIASPARELLKRLPPSPEALATLRTAAAVPENARRSIEAILLLPRSQANDDAIFAIAATARPDTAEFITARLRGRNPDYYHGLSSDDPAVRRGAMIEYAQEHDVPEGATLAKLLTIPERDDPNLKTAVGDIVCRFPTEQFEQWARAALVGTGLEKIHAMEILNRAADASPVDPSPANSASNRLFEGRQPITTAAIRQRIMIDGSENEKSHMAEHLLGFQSHALGPVTRRSAMQVVERTSGDGNPNVFYAGALNNPDSNLPWTSATVNSQSNAAGPSHSSFPEMSGFTSVFTVLLGVAMLLGVSLFRALQP